MYRIGGGYDIHRVVEGRPLMLGGVKIPWNKGLLGHSDADVLLHAATDALLGAVGLGDIGLWYSDSNPQFAGMDSSVILYDSYQKVQEKGWSLVNLDATIHAEVPKLRPYIPAIKTKIATVLKLEVDQINVKAKTREGLGSIGKKEAIAASVVILLRFQKGDMIDDVE